MLDIKFIRENSDLVKAGLASKNEFNKVDELLDIDKKRRELITKTEELKSRKNKD